MSEITTILSWSEMVGREAALTAISRAPLGSMKDAGSCEVRRKLKELRSRRKSLAKEISDQIRRDVIGR